MWIFVRLAAAVIAFFLRMKGRVLPASAERVFEGAPVYVDRTKHKRQVVRVRVGVDFDSRVVFRLTPETGADRFFKAIGLSREFQAGDAEFDHAVYVACDHEVFGEGLAADVGLREAVRALMRMGFSGIIADGKHLWIERWRAVDPSDAELAGLLTLRSRLESLSLNYRGQFADAFAWKVLIAESLVWSIGAYAVFAAIELVFASMDSHVWRGGLLRQGVAFGLALGGAVLAGVWMAFRGSSRGHRVLIESWIVLLLSVPIAGVELVSDLNQGLDSAPSKRVERRIASTDFTSRRTRHGGRSYTYYVKPDSPGTSDGFLLPERIRVSREIYEQAAGRTMVFEIAPGWLGHPWYRSMRVR